ncbi:hypothetical protein HU200_049265 [Digitaria exilis]|uniref:SMP domain-containing protein n=1 Tax=Digitaria exilis TaxID=1010633 RepID=A0A835EC32_9POAL|nr:hypothetical protein HU200_049265 [Digitaria exilis]CAB3499586.1 unnamed protein product [Digitaria exilis]
MSQKEQQRRPPAEQEGQEDQQGGGAVLYGDVFAVEGELGKTPIAPRDAAMMQEAESAVLGRVPTGGGTASVMQSAARRNERLGVVSRDEASDAASDGGVAITEARVPGARVITEFVAGQPVGQYITAAEDDAGDAAELAGDELEGGGGVCGGVVDGTKITIGEALEAAALSAGDEPVEPSDVAAIAAAEARAVGADEAPPDGLAARARAAADANAKDAAARREADKATLRDVLADATSRLGADDKEVEREDAARVVGAEVRGDPDATARPGGVAASIAAAARLNRGRQ